MPRFAVTQKKEAELLARMNTLGILESDLDESFISSGGPGGQKVNRTASCVQLRHKPSGLEVKMQQARSQSLNRFYARRRLCELMELKDQGMQSQEARRMDKIRRQKSRRRRRSSSDTINVKRVNQEDSITKNNDPESG